MALTDGSVVIKGKTHVVYASHRKLFADYFLVRSNDLVSWFKSHVQELVMPLLTASGQERLARSRHMVKWCGTASAEFARAFEEAKKYPVFEIVLHPYGSTANLLGITANILTMPSGDSLAVFKVTMSENCRIGPQRSNAVAKTQYLVVGKLVGAKTDDDSKTPHVLGTIYRFIIGRHMTGHTEGSKRLPFEVLQGLAERELFDLERHKHLIEEFEDKLSRELLSASQGALCDVLTDAGIPSGIVEELIDARGVESVAELMHIGKHKVLIKGIGLGNLVALNNDLRTAIVKLELLSSISSVSLEEKHLLVTPAGILGMYDLFVATADARQDNNLYNLCSAVEEYVEYAKDVVVWQGTGGRWIVHGDKMFERTADNIVDKLNRTKHVINVIYGMSGILANKWDRELEQMIRKIKLAADMASLYPQKSKSFRFN